MAEQGVVIWNSGLTKGQESDLEKIQKDAFRIILADDYMSYDLACSYFGVKKLSERRLELCTNFALTLYKSDKSAEFFKLAKTTIDIRQVIENKDNTKLQYVCLPHPPSCPISLHDSDFFCLIYIKAWYKFFNCLYNFAPSVFSCKI